MSPDLENPIVTDASLRRALEERGLDHVASAVLEETGSTNADLAARAATGHAGHGSLIVARHQTSARGRLERTWSSIPDSSVLMSFLIDPALMSGGGAVVPDETYRERFGTIPVAVGAGVVAAVREVTGVHAELKWPNDVLVGDRKLAGILCQLVPHRGGHAVVVGIGLNVRQSEEELPVETAVSLRTAGCESVDAAGLIAAIVDRSLIAASAAFVRGDLSSASAVMATLGQQVRVERVASDPSQDQYGTAVELTPDGALAVRGEDGLVFSVKAGDVWHVRAAGTPRTPSPQAETGSPGEGPA